MGKQSRKRKRAIKRYKRGLLNVIGLTETFYNDSRMTNVCNAAKKALSK